MCGSTSALCVKSKSDLVLFSSNVDSTLLCHCGRMLGNQVCLICVIVFSWDSIMEL